MKSPYFYKPKTALVPNKYHFIQGYNQQNKFISFRVELPQRDPRFIESMLLEKVDKWSLKCAWYVVRLFYSDGQKITIINHRIK